MHLQGFVLSTFFGVCVCILKIKLPLIDHKSEAVIPFDVGFWSLNRIDSSASLRQLGQLLASTCKELPGPKESRRTAKELWEVVVQICSVSIQHKRNSDGRVGLIKHRESSMGILYRYAAAAIAGENLTPNRSLCSIRCLLFSPHVSPTQEQIHHFH